MEVLLQGIQPTIAKLERINPPNKLREHYDILLGCPKTQLAAIGGMAAALRRKDQAAYAAQMTTFQSSLQDCTGTGFSNRVRAALERAGFHSPDDIDKAVAKGGLETASPWAGLLGRTSSLSIWIVGLALLWLVLSWLGALISKYPRAKTAYAFCVAPARPIQPVLHLTWSASPFRETFRQRILFCLCSRGWRWRSCAFGRLYFGDHRPVRHSGRIS